jgi:hypothetical protein
MGGMSRRLPLPRLWRFPATGPGVRMAAACGALLLLWQVSGTAQNVTRRLTTVDAVHEYASYFHLQQVLLRGEFAESGVELVLRADASDLRLVNPDAATGGTVEVRGQIIDVGRLEPGDPRLMGYAAERPREQWPRPGAELVLHVSSVTPADPGIVPSVRAIALEPWRFDGQTVTLRGMFRARNLFGDLPAAPGKDRHDFVLSGSEGAIWVTGRRPRGRDFEFDVERRMDADRWLEVSGVVTRCGTLVCLDASGIALAAAPDPEPIVEESPVPPAPLPPVEVVFSLPTDGEIDVSPASTVRVQFSKELRSDSIEGRIRARYIAAQPGDPPLEVTAGYDGASRAIQLTFARPLEPYSTVVVEVLEGMVAADGADVLPTRITFSVGAR